MKIFKYDLEVVGEIQTVMMPLEAEILTVQTQDNKIKLWALVYPNNKPKPRRFQVFGTGHLVEYSVKDSVIDFKYLGTVQIDHGVYVFHVFEV